MYIDHADTHTTSSVFACSMCFKRAKFPKREALLRVETPPVRSSCPFRHRIWVNSRKNHGKQQPRFFRNELSLWGQSDHIDEKEAL